MALQHDRVIEEADALAAISSRATKLLSDIVQVLEHNSDLSIDWGHSNPKTFTADSSTDTLTATAHGLSSGQKARVSTSGALPAGLAEGADYWLVAVAANTFQLAASKGGQAIDITGNGSGTHTLHPTPDYFSQEQNGNLSGRTFSRQQVSNAIGSLDWVRKLLTNQDMSGSQGDHLGNLNQLSRPLGGGN